MTSYASKVTFVKASKSTKIVPRIGLVSVRQSDSMKPENSPTRILAIDAFNTFEGSNLWQKQNGQK